MSAANERDENPYASPQANCLHEENLAIVLHRAVVIFRRMGWGGVLMFGSLGAVNCAMNLSSTDPDFLVSMFILSGYTAFFWSMLSTARRLEKKFDTGYRRARWTAIIAGTFFFPFLTLPCYFAACSLEEYKRRRPVETRGDDFLETDAPNVAV